MFTFAKQRPASAYSLPSTPIMESPNPSERTSLATTRSSVLTIPTPHSSIYSRRSSSSSAGTSLPTLADEDTLLKLRASRLAAQQTQSTRLTQTSFIVAVLQFLGYGVAVAGSNAMILHGVGNACLDDLDSIVLPTAEVIVPRNVDIAVTGWQARDGVSTEKADGYRRTVNAVAEELVERFPQWFFLEFDVAPTSTGTGAVSTTLFFHDPANLINAALAMGVDDFALVVKMAAENPPPPRGGKMDDGSPPGTPVPGGRVGERTGVTLVPVEHPYAPAPLNHKTVFVAGNGEIPVLPLPVLLIATLSQAHERLRSLQTKIRATGTRDLRRAVTLSKHMRDAGNRRPARSPPPPAEAIAVLKRLRGEKGGKERDVIMWVLRVQPDLSIHTAGNHDPLSGGPLSPTGTIGGRAEYVPGQNKQLRELTLVKRSESWRMSMPASAGASPNLGVGGMWSAAPSRAQSVRSFDMFGGRDNRRSSFHAGLGIKIIGHNNRNDNDVLGHHELGDEVASPVSSVFSINTVNTVNHTEQAPPPVPPKDDEHRGEEIEFVIKDLDAERREKEAQEGSGERKKTPPPPPAKRSASVRWSFKAPWGGSS